jgi:hypothetical protein
MLHIIIYYHNMQYESQAVNSHPIRVYVIVL